MIVIMFLMLKKKKLTTTTSSTLELVANYLIALLITALPIYFITILSPIRPSRATDEAPTLRPRMCPYWREVVENDATFPILEFSFLSMSSIRPTVDGTAQDNIGHLTLSNSNQIVLSAWIRAFRSYSGVSAVNICAAAEAIAGTIVQDI